MSRLMAGCVAVALSVAWPARGQVTVVVPGAQTQAIAVTGFAGDPALATQVAEVLKNDLNLSGHFTVVPSTQAKYVQQGTVRVEGKQGVIECAVTLQATRQVVLSRSYTGSTADIRRMVHRLTDDIVQELAGQKGIAQSKIAFVLSKGGGVKELAVMDYDGYNARQLTHDRSLNLHPRWSPDGRKIVYTSYLHRYPDIIEVDLFTGQRRKLASYPGLNSGACYSPDGRQIALTLSKDGNPELYVMDANGGGLRRLSRTRGGESSPCWSPDGEQIAFVSDHGGSPQVYSVGSAGGEAVRLTRSPSFNTEPAWSHPPAGSPVPAQIAVTSRMGGQFVIGLFNAQTGEVRALTSSGDSRDPAWGPNGRHLVFSKEARRRSRLYLLDVLANKEVELPAVEGDASEPAWGR